MKVVGKKQTMISRVAAGKSGSGPLKLLPGLQNSADLSSKLFFNAIEKINSDLYRKGPLSFTNPNDIKISIKDGEQLEPIEEEAKRKISSEAEELIDLEEVDKEIYQMNMYINLEEVVEVMSKMMVETEDFSEYFIIKLEEDK